MVISVAALVSFMGKSFFVRFVSHSQFASLSKRETEEIVRIRGIFSVQVQNITEIGPTMTENKPKKIFFGPSAVGFF